MTNWVSNSLISTQVKIIGEGAQLEIKRGVTMNLKLQVCPIFFPEVTHFRSNTGFIQFEEKKSVWLGSSLLMVSITIYN